MYDNDWLQREVMSHSDNSPFRKITLILNGESTLILKLYQQSRGKQRSQL
jgi:hypothetical protein